MKDLIVLMSSSIISISYVGFQKIIDIIARARARARAIIVLA